MIMKDCIFGMILENTIIENEDSLKNFEPLNFYKLFSQELVLA